MFLNQGQGKFSKSDELRYSASKAAFQDLNGDGKADLVTSSNLDAEIRVFLGGTSAEEVPKPITLPAAADSMTPG